MGTFPEILNQSSFIINTASPQALGYHRPLLTGNGLAVWPVANTALYIPFLVSEPIVIVKILWQNHSAVSGNIDAGIYNQRGDKMVSIGSTAQSGTSVIQSVDITDTTLTPGLYYMALAMDNTTGGVRRFAQTAAGNRAMGVYMQTSAFPLPSTATFATTTQAYVPVMSLTARVLI